MNVLVGSSSQGFKSIYLRKTKLLMCSFCSLRRGQIFWIYTHTQNTAWFARNCLGLCTHCVCCAYRDLSRTRCNLLFLGKQFLVFSLSDLKYSPKICKSIEAQSTWYQIHCRLWRVKYPVSDESVIWGVVPTYILATLLLACKNKNWKWRVTNNK